MKWNDIAETLSDLVMAVEPIIAIAAPAVAPALHIAEKLFQGVLAAEPTAVALYNRMISGEVPTSDELQKFSAEYEDAYKTLKADIAAKLASAPA